MVTDIGWYDAVLDAGGDEKPVEAIDGVALVDGGFEKLAREML